jgi:hypothetical protein
MLDSNRRLCIASRPKQRCTFSAGDNAGTFSLYNLRRCQNGIAHGFQTLSDATEVLYQMTDAYAPDLAAGFRWNDPSFGIEWPVRSGIVISERDALYSDFDRQAFESELARRSGAGT